MFLVKRLIAPIAVLVGLMLGSTTAFAASTTYEFRGNGAGTVQGSPTGCAFTLGSSTTSCQSTGAFTAQAGPLPLVGTYVQAYTIAANKAYVGTVPGEICAPATASTALFTGAGNIYMKESGDACEFPPGSFGTGSEEEFEFIGNYSLTRGTGAFAGSSGNGLFVSIVTETGTSAGSDSITWAGTIKL